MDEFALVVAVVAGGAFLSSATLFWERWRAKGYWEGMKLKASSCNLCGAPRCLHCNAHLDGSRADGYCSDGCASGPTKMRKPLGFSRSQNGGHSRADRFLGHFGD